MIGVKSHGNFNKTLRFLERAIRGDIFSDLDRYGRIGVEALASATPKDTELTSRSWGYRVIRDRGNLGIEWYNTNTITGGTPVAILLQYGHGTGTGGYVYGIDFINPAIRPVFDQIAIDVWKKVTE